MICLALRVFLLWRSTRANSSPTRAARQWTFSVHLRKLFDREQKLALPFEPPKLPKQCTLWQTLPSSALQSRNWLGKGPIAAQFDWLHSNHNFVLRLLDKL